MRRIQGTLRIERLLPRAVEFGEALHEALEVDEAAAAVEVGATVPLRQGRAGTGKGLLALVVAAQAEQVRQHLVGAEDMVGGDHLLERLRLQRLLAL